MKINKNSISDILFIILVSAVISFTYNYFSPNGIPLLRQARELTFSEEGIQDINEINDSAGTKLRGLKYKDILNLYNNHSAQFIDARDQWEFGEGHIPGAVNIPEFSFDPKDNKVRSLDRQKLYVIYCDGDDCDTSKRLAEYLTKAGFSNLYVYTGGYKEWIANGNNSEAGE